MVAGVGVLSWESWVLMGQTPEAAAGSFAS